MFRVLVKLNTWRDWMFKSFYLIGKTLGEDQKCAPFAVIHTLNWEGGG